MGVPVDLVYSREAEQRFVVRTDWHINIGLGRPGDDLMGQWQSGVNISHYSPFINGERFVILTDLVNKNEKVKPNMLIWKKKVYIKNVKYSPLIKTLMKTDLSFKTYNINL